MCEDEDKRLSGITNSADIVKVKDSNYVVTEVADYTQYAQVSNKIDQSPNALQIAQSTAGILPQSSQSSILNMNYRASHIPLKQSLLQQQQLLQYQHQERQNLNPSIFGHSEQGRSQLQISEQNPIKTSMNENDEKSEFHISNSKFNPVTGMTGGTMHYGTQGSSSASCLMEQKQRQQQNLNNSTQNNGVNLLQTHPLPHVGQPPRMTAVPSTSVFNYSLKSFNDGLKQQQEPDSDQENLSQIQANGMIVYNQANENHLLQDYEEFKQQNHFSFNFQQQDLQFIKSQKMNLQQLEQSPDSKQYQKFMQENQTPLGYQHDQVNENAPSLILAHSRMAPQSQNQMLSSQLREQANQSTYSDDNKKSVFLYSSSNDEINFHQLNPQSQLQLSQKFYQNAPAFQKERQGQAVNLVPIALEGGNQFILGNGQILSGIASGNGSGLGTGNNSSKASNKNSIQFFSKINSNSSVGMGQTIYPMSQVDLQNNISSPQNNMFKTTSSNFQISEITSSLIKDGTQTSLINFNPPQNYANYLAQQTLLLNGTKNLDEEEQDYDLDELDKMNPDAQNFPNQQRFDQQNHFDFDQQKRDPCSLNSYLQNQELERQEQEQDSSNLHAKVSFVEDSFQYCDYDEYLEEKCSLSDNAVSNNDFASQQQMSLQGSQQMSLQNSQSKAYNSISQPHHHSGNNQSRSQSLNSNFKKLSYDQNNNSDAISKQKQSHQNNPSISSSSQRLPPKNPHMKDHSLTNSEFKYGSVVISEQQNNQVKDKLNYKTESITNYQSTMQEPSSKRNDGSLFQSNMIGGSSIIPNGSAARYSRSLQKNQINYSKRSQGSSSGRESFDADEQSDAINIRNINGMDESHNINKGIKQNVLNLTASTPTDGLNSASMTTLSNQMHQNPSDYRTSLHPGEAHLVLNQDRQVINAYLQNGYLEQDSHTLQEDNEGFVDTFGNNENIQNTSSHYRKQAEASQYVNRIHSNKQTCKPSSNQLCKQQMNFNNNGYQGFNTSGMNASSSENFTYTHSNTNTHTKIGQGLSTSQQHQKSTQLYGDEGQFPPNISTSQDHHERDDDNPYENEDDDYNHLSQEHVESVQDNLNDEDEQPNYQQQEEQMQKEDFQDLNLQKQRQVFGKKTSVADRLLYQEKLKQQKIEIKRMQRQNQEMMLCTGIPQISRNSVEILKSKDMSVPAYLDFENHFEAQRRKEDLKRAYDNQKLKEVTGKPRISQKAQSLTRDVSDLYSWQKDLQRKKEDLQRIKEEKERQELEKHKQVAQNYVNKESQKILMNKENQYHNQRIEERLINIGVMNKVKKEQAAHKKVLENIQVANSYHQKRDKKSKNSIILENRKKLNDTQSEKVLSMEELKHISANKERKDLYKKYYQEKKREAEVKLLSTEKLQQDFNMSPRGKAYDPHGIGRSNLYQTQQFISLDNLSNLIPQNQSLCNSVQPNYDQVMLGMSPINYQIPQDGSQSVFDLQRPVNYCSFGNVQQSLLQNSNSQPAQNMDPVTANPYSAAFQNTMSPYSNASQTCNGIYAQLIMQAQSQNNSTFVSTNADQQQCLSNMFASGMNSQAYQTQGSACFNLKANSVCDGGSNASTTCFDKHPDLHFQSAKTLDQNDFKNDIKTESRLSLQQNPYRINIPGAVTDSRSRSKSKGKLAKSKSSARGRDLHQKNNQINQQQLYSLSPNSKKIVGDGKLQSAKENTRFYERSRKWSKERENKILHEQEKTNIIETLKCTFRPKISENSNRLMSPDYLEQKSRSIIDPKSHPKSTVVSNPATFKQQAQQQPNYLSYRNNQKIMKPVTLTKEIMIEQFINSSISPLKDNQRVRDEDGGELSNDNSFSEDSQQQDAFLVQVMNSNPCEQLSRLGKENQGVQSNIQNLQNQVNELARAQSYGLHLQSNVDISSKNFNLMRCSQASGESSYSQSNQSLTQKNDYQGFGNQIQGQLNHKAASQLPSRNSQVLNSARQTHNNSQQNYSVTQGNNQSMNMLSYSQSSSMLMSQQQLQPSQQEYQSRYGLQSNRY